MEISNVPISRISCSTFYSDQPGSINLKITKNPDFPVDSVLLTFNSSFSSQDLSIKSNSIIFSKYYWKGESLKQLISIFPFIRNQSMRQVSIKLSIEKESIPVG